MSHNPQYFVASDENYPATGRNVLTTTLLGLRYREFETTLVVEFFSTTLFFGVF